MNTKNTKQKKKKSHKTESKLSMNIFCCVLVHVS